MAEADDIRAQIAALRRRSAQARRRAAHADASAARTFSAGCLAEEIAAEIVRDDLRPR